MPSSGELTFAVELRSGAGVAEHECAAAGKGSLQATVL